MENKCHKFINPQHRVSSTNFVFMLSIYFVLKLSHSFAPSLCLCSVCLLCWDCSQQHTKGWLLCQRFSWHPQTCPTELQSACDSSWDIITHSADTRRESLWNWIPAFSIPTLRLSKAWLQSDSEQWKRMREQKGTRRGCLFHPSSNSNPECHLFLSYIASDLKCSEEDSNTSSALWFWQLCACTKLVFTASDSLLKKKKIPWATKTATAEEPNWMEEVWLTNHRTLLIWSLHFEFLNPCVLNGGLFMRKNR